MVPIGVPNDKDLIMSSVCNSMPAGMTGESLKELISGLSSKELKILRNYQDLKERVAEISRMNAGLLINNIRDHFGLDVTRVSAGSQLWIGPTEKLEALQPPWDNDPHYGWYVDLKSGEFSTWARDLLMQEVRVNIHLRYLHHQKNKKTKGNVLEDELFLPGMYL